ncbi:MAG: primosomal protein DnaI, partial [Bacilli bacterium]|nr:primosomal protein DnaI [Bacilli bacterium]
KMKNIETATNKFNKKDLKDNLKKAYIIALKNPKFKKLINTLKVKEDLAFNYTTKLEDTLEELANCSKCKSLHECKNKVTGFVYYPKLENNRLLFDYVACKYKKKELKETENIKSNFFEVPVEIKKAKMADIHKDDAKRLKIIKWLTNFYNTYQKDNKLKGLYLCGSFGSGKTYLISALLNELSKKDNDTVIIYYPELLRSLKESFESNDFSIKINRIKKADLLLLDDIGAETVTPWNRDEILGTILQYRMDNKLATFFTSNLNLKELESHFINNKTPSEAIKARRIIERIKQITEYQELISENRRK